MLEPYFDNIFPKKASVVEAKGANTLSFVVIDKEPLFFNWHDGPYYPVLRLLHKCIFYFFSYLLDPIMLPKMQVDRGAVKFIMSGAHIMCPGLTSPGASMEDVPANTIVAVMVEGKEHALGVGLTKLSTEEMYVSNIFLLDSRTINSGVGVDNIHYLGDDLYKTTKLE